MRLQVMAFLLMVSQVAFAADIYVDPMVKNGLVAAVAAARPGDTVVLRAGFHVVQDPVVVTSSITIAGEHAPREIDPSALGAESTLWIDVSAGNWVSTSKGVIMVSRENVTLTLRDVVIKFQEILCKDRIDNDGNGVGDDQDPACQGAAGDTFAHPGDSIPPNIGELRAVYLTPGDSTRKASLNMDRVQIQGFSIGVRGVGIYGGTSSIMNVNNSLFVYNIGLVTVNAAGGYDDGQGTIYAQLSSTVNVTKSRFESNSIRYGGAIHVTDGTHLSVLDSVFHSNTGEDGGALFVENSFADIKRNYFVSNAADLRPGDQLWVEYEGGAIYAENAAITVKNNIFLQNSSLDWGGAIGARGSLGGSNPPEIVNNTFVENSTKDLGGSVSWFVGTDFVFRNNISFGEVSGIVGATLWPAGQPADVHFNGFFSGSLAATAVYSGQLTAGQVDRSTNIFDDPKFVYYLLEAHDDWRIWQFWLNPASRMIDSGDPAISDAIGGPSDMGAYGGPDAAVFDFDDDGWVDIYDCDDHNADVYPFAAEECDDLDNDCDGIVDNLERRWFADRDFDGYGNSLEYTEACPTETLPTIGGGGGRWVLIGGDCNDASSTINPGRAEFCDGEDNDCDGYIDNNLSQFTIWYIDSDHDGFGRTAGTTTQGACPPANDYAGYSPFNTDCKDGNATIHPLNSAATRTHPPLADQPEEFSEYDRSPAYVGDGIDQDCDGGDLCYADYDGDRFGDRGVAGEPPPLVRDDDLVCNNGSIIFTSANAGDCDDGNRFINPDQAEIAGDGYDQNCDGRDLCYLDEDGDGYGSEILVQAPGLVCGEGDDKSASKAGDCDDSPATGAGSYPSNAEICDALDNNCNGEIDEVSSPDATTWFLDADGDSWGDVRYQQRACGQPIGYVANQGDCNDSENRTFPLNPEVCDGIDNNCVSGVDESTAVDADTWYQDVDGDGYGSKNLSTKACSPPEDGVWVSSKVPLDCDDNNVDVGPCPEGCPKDGGCSQSSDGRLAPFALSMAGMVLLRRRRRVAA